MDIGLEMNQIAPVVTKLKAFANDPVFLISKLWWEIDEIKDPKNAAAIPRMCSSLNAAFTAWHIHEWLWKLATVDEQDRIAAAFELPKKSAVEFGKACQKSATCIRICRQIAVAGKHVVVDYDDPTVYPEAYARDGEAAQDCYVVLHSAGEQFADTEVYEAALQWWISIYVQLGFAGSAELAAVVSEDGLRGHFQDRPAGNALQEVPATSPE
jgi:hypothetical protein